MDELTVFAISEKWDERKHLESIDDLRLSCVPDEELVSIMVQRKYLADLRLQDKWKKEKKKFHRPLRFKRVRS